MGGAEERDVTPGGEVLVERRALRHVPDPLPELRPIFQRVQPHHPHPAARGGAPTRPLMRAVLPAPLGPTRPNTSPRPTDRSTPRSGSNRPYFLANPETSMAFISHPPFQDPAGK